MVLEDTCPGKERQFLLNLSLESLEASSHCALRAPPVSAQGHSSDETQTTHSLLFFFFSLPPLKRSRLPVQSQFEIAVGEHPNTAICGRVSQL